MVVAFATSGMKGPISTSFETAGSDLIGSGMPVAGWIDSGITGADLTDSETDAEFWAVLFLLALCFLGVRR